MMIEWVMRNAKCGNANGLFFLSGVPNSALRNPHFNLFHVDSRDHFAIKITLNSMSYINFKMLTLSAADQNIKEKA